MPENAFELREQSTKARDILSRTQDSYTRAMLQILAEQLEEEAERLEKHLRDPQGI